MSVTSLKLPATLKQRVQTLVEDSGQSAHAFMVQAIERAARQAELRARFGAEAQAAEVETDQSGMAFAATEVFDYLEGRARGEKPRRPRARAWRRSG